MHLKISMLGDNSPRPDTLLVVRGKESLVDQFINSKNVAGARPLNSLFSVTKIIYAIGDEQKVWGDFLDTAQRFNLETLASIASDTWNKSRDRILETSEFGQVFIMRNRDPGIWHPI